MTKRELPARNETSTSKRMKTVNTDNAHTSNSQDNGETSPIAVPCAASNRDATACIADANSSATDTESGSHGIDVSLDNYSTSDRTENVERSPGTVKTQVRTQLPVRKLKNVDTPAVVSNSSNVLTVQGILPHPITRLVDDKQIAHYSDVLKKRINILSQYVNRVANVYSLGNILPTATWGKYHPMSDHSKMLCNPATNDVIIIWIVGHVVSTWFQNNGYAEKQASITVMPLSDELRTQTARLLAGLSVPHEVSIDMAMPAIRAIKWQTAKGDDNPILFSAVYDAREVLKAKSEMETLSVIDLKKNDLVLLETKVTHFRMKDVKTDKWGQQAQLEITAISLLHSASVVQDEEQFEERDIDDLWV